MVGQLPPCPYGCGAPKSAGPLAMAPLAPLKTALIMIHSILVVTEDVEREVILEVVIIIIIIILVDTVVILEYIWTKIVNMVMYLGMLRES